MCTQKLSVYCVRLCSSNALVFCNFLKCSIEPFFARNCGGLTRHSACKEQSMASLRPLSLDAASGRPGINYDDFIEDPFKPGSGAQFAKLIQRQNPVMTATSEQRVTKGTSSQDKNRTPSKKTRNQKGGSKVKRKSENHRLKTSHCFVRIRPLLDKERANGVAVLPGLVIDGNCPIRQEEEQTNESISKMPAGSSNSGVNAFDDSRPGSHRTPIGGFTGVFGWKEDNIGVFEKAFLPRISTVLSGSTASLFAYGQTGSGKTHTIFGYRDEPGMYALAADELISLLEEWNDANPSKESVMLQVSCIEVYNDDVFDLLNGRAPCLLRKNTDGSLMVRGKTTKRMLTTTDSEMEDGIEFVVETEGLVSVVVRTPEDINDIHTLCSSHRAVGSSSTHDQSSRSHAIFAMDVVSDSLLEVKKRIEKLEAMKPGLETLYAKKRTFKLRKKLVGIEEQLKSERELTCRIIDKGNADKSPLGGRMIFVDLAGNDSDDRTVGKGGHTKAQQRESNAINKSLLALKECLRGLCKGSPTSKLPFRDSAITRLLEEVLIPQRGRDCETVMLVNVSPGAHLDKKTTNTLRYGQMFVSNSVRRRGSGISQESGRRRFRNPRLGSAPTGLKHPVNHWNLGLAEGNDCVNRVGLRPNTEPQPNAVATRQGDYDNYRTQGDFDDWDS